MGKSSFGHPVIRPLADGWLLAWYAGSPDRATPAIANGRIYIRTVAHLYCFSGESSSP